MGSRAGRGFVASINNGAHRHAVLILWGLFVHSCNEMVRLAMRNRYDGPLEAIVEHFPDRCRIWHYDRYGAHLVWLLLVAGGWYCRRNAAGKRWR